VLLTEPAPSSWDLRFRLFGTAVRVHPWFWLVSVLLGWRLTQNPILSDNGFLDLSVWVLAVFVSILLHEFGHIWMGQAFGSHGHIVLHSLGGLAIGSSALDRAWQRILVSAAGPGIQLLLAAALYGVKQSGNWPEWGTPLWFLAEELWYINFGWALVNLLPIWPLDGGQIAREVCASASPRNGTLAALWISLALSATLAVNALVGDNGEPFIPYSHRITGRFMAIFFALFALGSWQAIQAEKYSRETYGQDDDRLPWER
jgi:Zn-dependent protease